MLCTHLSAIEGFTWKFNPANCPHMGGLWESNLKSMKRHIAKVIGPRMLDFLEMESLLIQVEACMNSRPLCTVSSELDDPEIITPGHFLIGRSPVSLPLASEKSLPPVGVARR